MRPGALWLLASLVGSLCAVLLAQGSRQPMHYVVMWSGAQVGTYEISAADSRTREYAYRPLPLFAPQTTSRVTIDADWIPARIEIGSLTGGAIHIDERFSIERGHAEWANRSEREQRQVEKPAFYISVDGGEWFELLPRALLAARDGALSLLPSGEARLQREADRRISVGDRTRVVVQYRLTGTSLGPVPVWLDADGSLFAIEGRAGVLIIRAGWEAAFPQLQSWARQMRGAHWAAVARTLSRKPQSAVAIRNARLFDPERRLVTSQTTVILDGNRVTAVGPDRAVPVPNDAVVLDAEGKTLLPGLWDMHGHASGVDGLLNIAAGVTGVRNPAGDPTLILADRGRWNDGTEIGPRMVWSGVVDAIGPATPPMGPELGWMFPSTEDGVREAVRRHAQLGASQIKIYNSLRPEFVPIVIDEAHRAGLQVGSHVPRGMTAEAAVRHGLDEIHHMGALFFNFRGDARESLPDVAARLDLDSPSVREFIDLLRSRRVVVDPTLNVQEARLTASPGAVMAGWQAAADRLPVLERRSVRIQGAPAPERTDRRNRDAFVSMLTMVRRLHEAGVQIVAGTDTDPTGLIEGFALHRELELYVQAGIPARNVLSLATLGAARAVRRDGELGSIAPGKLADLVLVDGDPLENISDIRRVILVIKDGTLYDPAALYRTVGIRPCCEH